MLFLNVAYNAITPPQEDNKEDDRELPQFLDTSIAFKVFLITNQYLSDVLPETVFIEIHNIGNSIAGALESQK